MITTFTHKYVNPLDIRTCDIDIRDIAHALALCNRFAGHTPKPVSVAQHSVYVSRLVGEDSPFALQALLHDGSEAYLGDMTKWVKAQPAMAGYREVEERVQEMVYTTFGCPVVMDAAVAAADKLMVRYEAFMMYGAEMPLFQRQDYPVPTIEEVARVGRWQPWGWREAEMGFLDHFRLLRSEA
jgi:hypothetical protein